MPVTIRPEQREVLARIPEAAFVDEMVEHVRAAPAAAHTPAPQDLRAWIEAAIERAKHHGITHERHVWQFVKLSLQLGAGFEAEPWAREILERRLSGATKLQLLRMRVDPPAEREHEAT